MKKQALSMLLAVTLLTATMGFSQISEARASEYLFSYSISITAKGSRQMCIVFDVNGTGRMTRIGAESLVIQKKSGTKWVDVQTLTPTTNPEIMGYNAYDHGAAIYFTGELNAVYQVIFTPYAGNSKGYDTRTIESFSAVCT